MFFSTTFAVQNEILYLMFKKTWILWLLALLVMEVNAQIGDGSRPHSFLLKECPKFKTIDILAPSINETDFLTNIKNGNPQPIGKVAEVTIDIFSDGSWAEIPGKGWVCGLELQLKGTKFITAYFSDFRLPEGGLMHIYDPEHKQVVGGFSNANNATDNFFATQPIDGEKLVLEVFIPYEAQAIGWSAAISGLTYVPDSLKSSTDFGNSGACEVNLACEEGEGWRDYGKGVVRILVRNGTSVYWCTGSLVNNVRQDKTPYILTADHCGNGATTANLNQWIFFFNYQSAICPNPIAQPTLQSMTGGTKVAASRKNSALGSDFYLLLLNNEVPKNYYSYFEGWSADGQVSNAGVCIHHPQGDIKKISTYTQPIVNSSWESTPNTHWKVGWTATANGHGVTEGGSSGSPLFSTTGHLIGTLTGGESTCDSISLTKPDFYGKMSYHWTSNGTADTLQLKPWLDPDNTGTLVLGGMIMGVESNTPSTQFVAYPIPAKDVLNIDLNTIKPFSSAQLLLYNSLGHCVLIQNARNGHNMIDINGLASGLYVVTLFNGTSQSSQKIILK